ncbi:hypothetical protein DID88_008810 [Monilinia fructigena]|uniref:Uncharacterized protein n=1 Tax=Monilinia fructigena TaxID=38457 RepID=A0A395J6H1_9HELO|nr:hypothetical protein DID88_008810 [Monilinia fructigena]
MEFIPYFHVLSTAGSNTPYIELVINSSIVLSDQPTHYGLGSLVSTYISSVSYTSRGSSSTGTATMATLSPSLCRVSCTSSLA